MKKNNDPFWWGLFGAGGQLSAFFLPILLIITGFALPLGWIDPQYPALVALVKHPLTRLFLFGVISLSFFHWAHRFRYTLYDGLQIKHLNEFVAIACYGIAIVVTIVAGIVLFSY